MLNRLLSGFQNIFKVPQRSVNYYLVGIYLFKVNDGNTSTMCEIYSK